MAVNIVRAAGIPVLACTKFDSASCLPCSLALRCSKDDKQATISLRFSFTPHGLDGPVTFTLLYHADNLVPGANTLKPANSRLPNNQLDSIAQGGNPDYRLMSLTIRKVCPIWCSASPEGKIHEQVNDPRLSQFHELAGVMEIQILFDYKWIPTQNHKLFYEILDHPERLSGLPVDGRRKDRHKYVFSKPKISNPTEDGLPEAPPPYSIESSTKRPRQASSTAASPSPKRALLSPAPVGSPTEKATTAPTSSPKAPLSPVARASDFQDAVTNALATILPDILANLHPDPTASLSPSSSPSSSKILHTNASPDPNPRQLSRQHSALRKLLGAHGASHASARLEQIFNSAMESALEVRNAGDIEFSEMLQDSIYELTTEKDKAIVEVNDEVDTCLAKMKEDIDAFEQDVFQRIEVKLDELVGKALGTSIEGGEHDKEREGDKERDLRQREKQAREREMEMCEREREIAQRERDVSKREMDLGRWERRMCQRERELNERGG